MLKLQLILRSSASNDWAAEQSLHLIMRSPSAVNGKYRCKSPHTKAAVQLL